MSTAHHLMIDQDSPEPVFKTPEKFDYVICYHAARFRDIMLGLPLLTIVAVGGLVVIVVIALLLWGLTFRGHD